MGNPGQSRAVRPPVTPIRKKSARVIKWRVRDARYGAATGPLRGPGTDASRRRWKCHPVVRAPPTARHAGATHIEQAGVARAQRVLVGRRGEKVHKLSTNARGHVRRRVAALRPSNRTRLSSGATVCAAVQPVAPRQLRFACTLQRSRLQVAHRLCFDPVLGPRTNMGVQRNGVRRRARSAVRVLSVCVACDAPSIWTRFRDIACLAVEPPTVREIKVNRIRIAHPVSITVLAV
jgi:hypothetical protein